MECAVCKFESCCGIFTTCDMSECDICSDPITTSCYKLCNSCSVNHNKCYICGISLIFNEEELEKHLQKLQKIKKEIIQDYDDLIFQDKSYLNIFENSCKVISDRLVDGRRDFYNFDFASEI
jgi:hypothetical protein